MTATKYTVAALKRACAKHNAVSLDIRTAGRWTTINADCLEGYVWDANGCSTLVTDWITGDAKHREEAVKDMLERVEMGISEDAE